jgi:glutamyl-tRNA synthetase
MGPPRLRFAPSPTGTLHIGGARTALFNWLWARRTGGRFILRIEDTDRERSTQAAVDAIFDAMRWLGLDWDEGPEVGGPDGPYFQTQRLEVYRAYAEKLLGAGRAYACTCTREELDGLRRQAEAEKRQFRYPGTCRDKPYQPSLRHVIRFRMPDGGSTTFDDLVKGSITTPHDTLQDEVILRADGMPLYNFGALVDDLSMRITLVARGDDHVNNTARQILMYRGLGVEPPAFAHLPMILGADKTRLSKRHGATTAPGR